MISKDAVATIRQALFDGSQGYTASLDDVVILLASLDAALARADQAEAALITSRRSFNVLVREHDDLKAAVETGSPVGSSFVGVFWDGDGVMHLGYTLGLAQRQTAPSIESAQNADGTRDVYAYVYDEDTQRTESQHIGYLVSEEWLLDNMKDGSHDDDV